MVLQISAADAVTEAVIMTSEHRMSTIYEQDCQTMQDFGEILFQDYNKAPRTENDSKFLLV